MPICIECQYPVQTLWTEYTGAGDKSSGHNIRLTVCRNCGQFCDKYVEHDFVVIFIDLVLIKPQVYRHLLHNTLMREGDQFDPSIVRLGVLLLLFDVYLTWVRIERQSNPEDAISLFGSAKGGGGASSPLSSPAPPPASIEAAVPPLLKAPAGGAFASSFASASSLALSLAPSSLSSLSSSSSAASSFLQNPADIAASAADIGRLAQQPIVFQYFFYLVLCALSTLAFHFSIRFLTSSPLSPLARMRILPTFHRPNSVSTALLVSSSTKLFPILMVIWEYDVPAAARSLGWAVVVNNIEALKILLDCGYGTAAFLAMAGALSRWAIGRLVLWVVGLGDVDGAGASSMAEDGRALWAVFRMVRDWAGRLAVG
ncbi:protein arv1 [Sporothrix schenckii 1099-18]|uniref:Protein ARV n=1 Tax=Sporothrix schenckii 1099-18 TaxID=1397361 RepID=A0A0F2M0E0_SPOSC|nr:protein arv1 [Sporothrix schenckii 1099-18]KJR82230.1 protein arv1 [Sporothrix schenckii 1099-18]